MTRIAAVNAGMPQQRVQRRVGDRAAADHIHFAERDRAVYLVAAEVQVHLPAGERPPPRVRGNGALQALGDAGHGGAQPFGCGCGRGRHRPGRAGAAPPWARQERA